LNFVFNVRCQFQLKHHWLGKNEKKHNRFVAPSRNESGFFLPGNKYKIGRAELLFGLGRKVWAAQQRRPARKNL